MLLCQPASRYHSVLAIVWWVSWVVYIWLVVDLPLWKTWVRQWEGWHPIYEMENKSHVPNHQPDICNYVIMWKYMSLVGTKFTICSRCFHLVFCHVQLYRCEIFGVCSADGSNFPEPRKPNRSWLLRQNWKAVTLVTSVFTGINQLGFPPIWGRKLPTPHHLRSPTTSRLPSKERMCSSRRGPAFVKNMENPEECMVYP